MNKILLTLAITMSGFVAMAQTEKAEELDNNWDYNNAVQLYEKAAAAHPNADIYFKIGECYRKMGKYDKALKAYDKVNSDGDYPNPEFYMQYGQMLKTSNSYDKAKVAFKKYEKMMPYDPKGKLYENSCDVAVEDNKGDLPIDIKNMSTINTKASEFCPVIFRDEVVFTSNLSNTLHNKVDEYTGSAYLALYSCNRDNDSSFRQASMLNKTINLQYHDGPACFSKNFDTMYFTRVNKELKGEAIKKYGIERGKIYYATIKDGDWGGVTAFPFNSDTFSVGHPALSPWGDRLYFASDMPGGMGGVDIWYCKRDRGGWSKPINAGPNINTTGTDNYPSVDSLGNLYFSSNGYIGFGGLDICVAKNNKGTLEKAQVLKCPLNSPADDFGMVFVQYGRRGYLSSNRDGGEGSDDIYYFNMGRDTSLTTNVYVIGYKRATAKQPEQPIAKTPLKNVPVVLPQDTTFDSLDIHIYFDLNKFNLRADASYKLGRIVAYLKTHSDKMVQINGFTDIAGKDAYNKRLSENRAKTVSKFLLDKGIKEDRLVTVGFGSTQLVLKEAVYDPVKEAINRRVQFQWLPYTPSSTLIPVKTVKKEEKKAGKEEKKDKHKTEAAKIDSVKVNPAPLAVKPIKNDSMTVKSAKSDTGSVHGKYTIEINTSKTEVPDNSPKFKGIDSVFHIKSPDGDYHYYYGSFSTEIDAKAMLNNLKESHHFSGTVVGLPGKIMGKTGEDKGK